MATRESDLGIDKKLEETTTVGGDSAEIGAGAGAGAGGADSGDGAWANILFGDERVDGGEDIHEIAERDDGLLELLNVVDRDESESLREELRRSSRRFVPLPSVDNVVFAGAGGRGFIYCGVALALEELGVLEGIKRVVGTSCGGIISTALALGYRGQDIVDILVHTDFGKFKDNVDRSRVSSIIGAISSRASDLYTIFTGSRGIYKGDSALNWLEFMIYIATGDPNVTFADLARMRETNLALKELYIVAANLTDGCQQVFSHETTPDVKIADAVLASMSLPGVFIPVRIEINGEIKEFVDGGLVNEYPMEVVDEYSKLSEDYGLNFSGANPATLGFRLDQKERIEKVFFRHTEIGAGDYDHSVSKWMDRIRYAATQGLMDSRTYNRYSCNTVAIDDMGISTLDFEATSERKLMIAEHGRRQTHKYFKDYRSCGTYYEEEGEHNVRIEMQRGVSAERLITEYQKLKRQYVDDRSLDIVKQENLLLRMNDIARYLATEHEEHGFEHDIEHLEELRAERIERFELAREAMAGHKRHLRERLAIFELSELGHISKKLEVIMQQGRADELNFLLTRDNHWVSKQVAINILFAKSSDDNRGDSMICIAAANGRENILNIFARYFEGPIFIRPGVNGMTPICSAAANGHLSVINFLRMHGAPIGRVYGSTEPPLISAVKNNKLFVALYMINTFRDSLEPNDLSAVDHEGKNILHHLFSLEEVNLEYYQSILSEILLLGHELLISMLKAKDITGSTPMHYLSEREPVDLLEILVRAVSDRRSDISSESMADYLSINEENSGGETVLQVARRARTEGNLFYARLASYADIEVSEGSITPSLTLTRVRSEPDLSLGHRENENACQSPRSTVSESTLYYRDV